MVTICCVSRAAFVKMAELHIVGQIISGSNFEEKTICCRWSFNLGLINIQIKKNCRPKYWLILSNYYQVTIGAFWKVVNKDKRNWIRRRLVNSATGIIRSIFTWPLEVFKAGLNLICKFITWIRTRGRTLSPTVRSAFQPGQVCIGFTYPLGDR